MMTDVTPSEILSITRITQNLSNTFDQSCNENMKKITILSVKELADQLKKGHISAVDVVKAYQIKVITFFYYKMLACVLPKRRGKFSC